MVEGRRVDSFATRFRSVLPGETNETLGPRLRWRSEETTCYSPISRLVAGDEVRLRGWQRGAAKSWAARWERWDPRPHVRHAGGELHRA